MTLIRVQAQQQALMNRQFGIGTVCPCATSEDAEQRFSQAAKFSLRATPFI